jgi:hypothetical protein
LAPSDPRGLPPAYATAEAAVLAAERRRSPGLAGAVDPTPAHWASLRVTLYQHALLLGGLAHMYAAERLHRFAHLVVSAPFFHPVPLACMKDNHPVAVLMQKCVPNRCQLRSLVDEITHCMRSHPSAREYVEISVFCSLLGLYPGSEPAPLPARRRFLRRYMARRADAEASAESVVETLLRLRCQQTLFFALKESLVYLVNRCNHAVRRVLEEFHGWHEFCTLVRRALDDARRGLRGDYGDLTGFEKSLSHVSKQKIRRLFSRQPSVRNFEATVTLECEKFFTRSCRRGRSCHWATLSRACLRVPYTDMPLSWLAGMARRPEDTPAQTADRAARFRALIPMLEEAKRVFLLDGTKTKLRQALATAGGWDDALVDVSDLSDVFRKKRTTRFVRLPASVTVQQIRALRRIYKVPDGVPLDQCPKMMGVCAVCEECDTFRSFLTPKTTRAKAQNGLTAFGFAQSLIDDDDFGFYCGRRPAAPERENSLRGAKTGRALRHARFHGTRCGDTKLRQINLIGRLLVFRSKMYTICCYCGNFFHFGKHQVPWHGDRLCCGRCVTQDGRYLFLNDLSCNWCGKACRAAKLCEIWTKDKQKRALCTGCCKPQFQNAPAYTLDWTQMCAQLTGMASRKTRHTT